MVTFVKRCIKAGFLLGCVFLMLIAARGESYFQPDGQVQETSYVQAYYDFLVEYISGEEEKEGEDEFSLLFIDDDEIPELLILQDNDEAAKVYSYCRGQVTELGEYSYSAFGRMLFRERSGVVIDQFSGSGPDGGEHYYFYGIEGGTSRELCHIWLGGFYSEEDTKYIPIYEIDGVSVQRDDFIAKWNELSDNHYDFFHEKSYSLK